MKKQTEKLAKAAFEKQLGQYLRIQREKKKITQQKIAKAAKFQSVQYISNIERGLCAPSYEILKIMILEYSLDPKVFFSFYVDLKKQLYRKIFLSP